MGEELGDFSFAHLLRVALAMEEDVTADLVDVHLPGTNAVMLEAKVPADTVEQFGFWSGEGQPRHRG